MRPIDADLLIDQWKEKASKMSKDGDGAIPVDFSLVISAVSKAPILTLDDLRPKGRWVKKPWKMLGCVLRYDTVCSECGFDAPEFTDGGSNTVLTRFCHNCGAKMENGEW